MKPTMLLMLLIDWYFPIVFAVCKHLCVKQAAGCSMKSSFATGLNSNHWFGCYLCAIIHQHISSCYWSLKAWNRNLSLWSMHTVRIWRDQIVTGTDKSNYISASTVFLPDGKENRFVCLQANSYGCRHYVVTSIGTYLSSSSKKYFDRI